MRDRLTWLHISDIHFQPKTEWRDSIARNSLITFLETEFKRDDSLKPDLILCTGDIAYGETDSSPLKDQYGDAKKFFDKLLTVCGKGSVPLPKDRLFIVPGNHDVNRKSINSDAQQTLTQWAKESSSHVTKIEQRFNDRTTEFRDAAKRLDEYAQFIQDYLPYLSDTDGRHRYTRLISIEGITVGIAGFNSAWTCAGPEDDRAIWLAAEWQFNGAKRELDQAQVRIGLIHHPVDCLTEADRNIATRRISTDFHFWLHGHSHNAWVVPTDSHVTIAAGAVGAESSEEFGVNLVRINFLSGKGEVYLYQHKAGGTSWTIAPIEDHAPHGLWPINLPQPIVVKCQERGLVDAPVPPQQEPQPPKDAVSYDPSNPPFYIPYRKKGDQVIGRDAALAEVRGQLTAGRRTAIGQTALFQGLGGLGKTQLAVEYAYRFCDEYPNGIIWLTADQDLDAQLTDLAVKAHWVAPASEPQIKLQVALHRLRSYSDCLIIFDNLENMAAITSYLPEPSAEPHILVTSRTEQPNFTYVPVELLDLEQSLRMLVQEAGRQPETERDWAAAREIARQLDGLPLALELAGAYLARRPVGWRDYLDLLQYNLKKALPPQLASLTGHEADLYSTLQVSENVIAEEPLLREVLNVLTWSGSAAMSRELLAALISEGDQGELINALGLGMALRILQQETDTKRYSLHRLVREVRREQAPLSEKADWAASLCRRVGDWFEVLREDFLQLNRFEVEVDHLREWHDHALMFAPKEASRLTWLQAYPPFHRGQFKEVSHLVELAFSEYENQACEDRYLLAHLQNDRAYVFRNFGEIKTARDLSEKALAIRIELFGEQHPDVATSLTNLGGYIFELGDPKAALELAEKALSIRRELFGEQHPDVATSLSNIGSCIFESGDPKTGLELAKKALAIRRELFGEQHPAVANSLRNMSNYIFELGDPKAALELAKKALAIRRELFGERHTDVADSLNNVAKCISKMGDPKAALELAEKALARRRELFGERHPNIACSLSNVASCYRELKDMQRSYDYARKACEIYKDVLGPQHPRTRSCETFLSGIRRPGFRATAGRKSAGKKKKKKM